MDLDLEYKIHQIVMQAQEKRPAELSQFLDRACWGNHSLRQEVEKRLEGIRIVLENMERLRRWDEQD